MSQTLQNHAPIHMKWMAETPELQHLRIDELILPGTHNSGSDKQSPNLGLPQEIAQDVSPHEQLRHGIRVLDLRVAFYKNQPAGSPRRFQLYHLTSSGRTVAVDIVQKVKAFFQELESQGAPAQEIVILDFHQFDGFTDEAHAELQGLLFDEMEQRLISYQLSDLTLSSFWADYPGRNVVIAYNHSSVRDEFWDGVLQRWPGENLFNTNTLKAFIDSVAQEEKTPCRLTAVQCAKYSLPFHAATDLSHKVDQWFASVDEWSYIQNFYIINTDWSLRHSLIAQCQHANRIRGQRALTHPEEPLQPALRHLNNG
ncbi:MULTISPECIES: hypothetical protein [unclassified Pseudomonas]|uniref:hypothetical protein n=1 Tax=unclassified Pseudomonas TaxID=196821 RepID=UPI0021145D3F|nr:MULTISPECIES: hypothetical protein [unclassified Pseudomonas]